MDSRGKRYAKTRKEVIAADQVTKDREVVLAWDTVTSG